MRLAGFAFTFALISTVAVSAQTKRTPSQPKPGTVVGEVTIRGCMQPGAERTTLTDSNGTTYLLRQAQGSSQDRAWVEVRGQQLSPPGQRGKAALPEIRVSSVHKLSDICPQRVTPPPSASNPGNQKTPPPAGWPSESSTAPQAPQAAPVINTTGEGGAPSPGTGNTQQQQQSTPPPK